MRENLEGLAVLIKGITVEHEPSQNIFSKAQSLPTTHTYIRRTTHMVSDIKAHTVQWGI